MLTKPEVVAYVVTAILSLLIACAELFSKFKDEPFYVVKNVPACLYIFFNMFIALVTLFLIRHTSLFDLGQNQGWLSATLISGLGSAVLLRSKLFNATVQGKEVAIGPEMIVKVFLETLERKIDRDRSLARKDLVEQCMEQVDFAKAKDYVLTTIVAARQTASPEEIRKLLDGVQQIEQSKIEAIDKGYSLGYLVLDMMGEEFLRNLFHDDNKERFLRRT